MEGQNNKEELRREIERQTQEFLSSGKKIQELPESPASSFNDIFNDEFFSNDLD